MNSQAQIVEAIESSPLNRGLRGSDWLASEGNIPINFENGDIALFDYEGDGSYSLHFFFKSRGKDAVRNGKEALRIMFEDHGAELIFGLTPMHLRHAQMFSRLIGGKSAGIRQTPDGPCELFILSKNMWKGAR